MMTEQVTHTQSFAGLRKGFVLAEMATQNTLVSGWLNQSNQGDGGIQDYLKDSASCRWVGACRNTGEVGWSGLWW